MRAPAGPRSTARGRPESPGRAALPGRRAALPPPAGGERSDRLAAADRNGVGEVTDARVHGPREIDLGRPAFAPQRHGVLDDEVEGRPEPGALLFERRPGGK